jgi:hypothetical protein
MHHRVTGVSTADWGSSSRCSSFENSFCGWDEGDGIDVAADQLGEDLEYDTYSTATPLAAGTGIADTDMAVYVFAVSTSKCTGGTMAYAATCQRDQYDRPVLGAINICPNEIDVTQLDAQLVVVLHEMAHALVFSASSWPLFRDMDADRTPRTPRDEYIPHKVDADNL